MKRLMATGFLFLATGALYSGDFADEMNYFDMAEQGTGYYKPRYSLPQRKAQIAQQIATGVNIGKGYDRELDYTWPYSVYGQERAYLNRLYKAPIAENQNVWQRGWSWLTGGPKLISRDQRQSMARYAEKSYRESADDIRNERWLNDMKIRALEKRNEQLQDVEKNVLRGISAPGPLYSSTERPFQINRQSMFSRMLDNLGDTSNSARNWVTNKWYRRPYN